MRDSDLHIGDSIMDFIGHDEELPEGAHVVHHYHHSVDNGPSLTIKGERNTKGWNVEIGVSGARTVEEAVKLLDDLKAQAEARFGGGVV